VGSLAFSPDGRTLVVGGSRHYFLVGNRAGLQFWDCAVPTGHRDNPARIRHSGGCLVCRGIIAGDRSQDGAVSLWTPKPPLVHRSKVVGSAVIRPGFFLRPSAAGRHDWAETSCSAIPRPWEVLSPALKAHTWRVLSSRHPGRRTLASAVKAEAEAMERGTRQLA